MVAGDDFQFFRGGTVMSNSIEHGFVKRTKPGDPISPLRQRLIQEMDRAGFVEKSKVNYICIVNAIQRHFRIRPDHLTEEQVNAYILWLRDESGIAPRTFETHCHALRFFYRRCLGYNWKLFTQSIASQLPSPTERRKSQDNTPSDPIPVKPSGQAPSPLRQRMIKDMELAGYSRETQQKYIENIAVLQSHFGIRPDRLTEKQVYDYILWTRDIKKVARGTFLPLFYGLKFFYYRCLGYDWALFAKKRVRKPRQKRLPIPISGDDCGRLIAAVRNPAYRLCLSLMYSLGLRISESHTLPVSAIDSKRLVLRVIGKRNTERIVPLPESLLLQLREFWKTHRHPTWLFPNQKGTSPLDRRAFYRAFCDARNKAGLDRKLTPHSLRHGFATQLLESGVDVRATQILLGHISVQSTQIYTHLTEAMRHSLRAQLNGMFVNVFPGRV
jgi:integrase/recombinase XerD